MHRTRLSLFYLLSYLTAGGIGLALAPAVALKLFLATGSYGDVMPRVVGMMMLALAMIVAAIIRLRLDAMYPVTLLVRLFLLTGLVALYFHSGDPFFLVIFGVVAVGVALTAAMWLTERKAA